MRITLFSVFLAVGCSSGSGTPPVEPPPDPIPTPAPDTLDGDWAFVEFEQDGVTFSEGGDPGILGYAFVDLATTRFDLRMLTSDAGQPVEGAVVSERMVLTMDQDAVIIGTAPDTTAYMVVFDADEAELVRDSTHPSDDGSLDGPDRIVLRRSAELDASVVGTWQVTGASCGGTPVDLGGCMEGGGEFERVDVTWDLSIDHDFTETVARDVFTDDACTVAAGSEVSEAQGLVHWGAELEIWHVEDGGSRFMSWSTASSGTVLTLTRSACIGDGCEDFPDSLVLER